MNQKIFISGTPTVGKTTIASKLAEELNAKLIKVNDFAFENNLVLGKDSKKGYKIIDIDNLNEKLQDYFKESSEEIIIVEGHLSHLCSNADKIIILRVNPDILKNRLIDRGYSNSKIKENLEAEALNVCGCEAFDIHGENVNEIDVSNLEIEEAVSLLEDIINDDKEFPFGNIDFMNWIIENS